jgi:hypothetical protein
MKKFSLLSGIANLLSREQLLNSLIYLSQKYKEANLVQNKIKKNLAKGPKTRGKNLTRNKKNNKEMLLEEARRLKKINPHIERKELAYELEIFSKNSKKNGLTRTYSSRYIYEVFLK